MFMANEGALGVRRVMSSGSTAIAARVHLSSLTQTNFVSVFCLQKYSPLNDILVLYHGSESFSGGYVDQVVTT